MSLSKTAVADLCTKLIVIVGPTAVGKTDLTVSLAQYLNAPIINADSRQLYAPLQIGTAAPTPQQLSAAKHYFVGTLGSLEDYYSAAQYEQDVLSLMATLDSEYAILSGGSMMYIDAVCNGIDDIPTIADEVRDGLKQRLANEGLDPLLAELRLLDPNYYAIVDPKNTRRVIHALEVCYQSGRPYSSFRTQTRRQRPFDIIKIGLERPREELFRRINQRVDEMMHDGLLDEVRRVLPYRQCNSLNTVGYKELFAYLDGQCSLSFAIEKIKRNTRVYSKKQMTWFKRDQSIQWLRLTDNKQHNLRSLLTLINHA